jgi:hypothetical protein
MALRILAVVSSMKRSWTLVSNRCKRHSSDVLFGDTLFTSRREAAFTSLSRGIPVMPAFISFRASATCKSYLSGVAAEHFHRKRQIEPHFRKAVGMKLTNASTIVTCFSCGSYLRALQRVHWHSLLHWERLEGDRSAVPEKPDHPVSERKG